MKREIELARGLKFDAVEFATEVVASLGNRGGGKSNGAAVAAEALMDAGVQVVVLDYVSIWSSLRLAPDGRTPSRFKIPVLGGPRGDLQLEPGAGRVVAEALASCHTSAVVDISSFHKSDRCRFATDFAEAFFKAKKQHPGPVQVLLEESQRFVPQHLWKGQERMLGAWEEIAEVGRNFGIGLHLISQRPQKISKDVLNLADTVLAYRTNGVLERKAVAEWVQEKGAEGRKEVQDELPSLDRGQAIVWSPSRRIFGRYQVRKKSTYDAGATPTGVHQDVRTTPIDLGALGEAMKSVVEESRSNDPKLLREQVARLRAELAKQPVAQVAQKRVEVPVVPREWVVQVGRAKSRAQALATQVEHALAEAGSLTKIFAMLEETSRSPGVLAAVPGVARAATPRSRRDAPPLSADGERKLSRCARALLQVLAQRHVANYSQLGILAGYSRKSSGFANALSELRTAGLVEGDRHSLRITAGGKVEAGDVEPLPTGPDLLRYWENRLGRCEATLLGCVYSAGKISRDDLAEKSGYSRLSSGFVNSLSTLRTLGLVGGPQGGDLEIADVFSDE